VEIVQYICAKQCVLYSCAILGLRPLGQIVTSSWYFPQTLLVHIPEIFLRGIHRNICSQIIDIKHYAEHSAAFCSLSTLCTHDKLSPRGRRDDMPPPADISSTRGGSTSVRGRVCSPHMSGGRPAAGSQRAYSLGWDRQTDGQTDGSRYRLMPPPRREGIITCRSLMMSVIQHSEKQLRERPSLRQLNKPINI